MKELFPSNCNNKRIVSANEKPITQQQYDDLVNRTNQAVSCADAAKQCVTDFNNNPNLNKSGVITARSICGTTQVASNLVYSNYATVNCQLCAGNIAIDDTHHIRPNDVSLAGITSDENITNIHGVAINDGSVTADGLAAAKVDARCINAVCCVSAAEVDANCVCAESVNVSASLNAQCATINCLDATNTNACNLTASSATIDCASISELNIQNFATDSMDTNAITHLSNPQEITFEAADTGDYYISLPIFTNGNYFIEARNDGGTKLWSVEALNSLKNIQVRWSENAYGYIVDFKIAEDASGASVLQIHANQLNEHATLYHQSISTSNTDHPTIYSTDQLSETEEFAVTQLAGTYIQDIIYTNTLNVKCLQMDNIEVDCVGARCHIRLTCGYDTEAPYCAILSNGSENQYIQNKDLGCDVVPTWVTPAECVEENNTNLMSSDAIYNYNGTATDCDGRTVYPISELADCTCVHGYLNVNNNLSVCGSCNVLSGVTTTATLCSSNGHLVSKYGVNSRCLSNASGDWKVGTSSTGGHVAPIDCIYDTCNNNPVVWDGSAKTLKRSDKIELNCADIENLSVHGDLYVDGTMHVDDVETVETTGNFLMTRTNCSSGLSANETSGIVVNNYDGCDNPIAIATDCTGTVRVGEADKTETTYATAIYNKTTDTWSDGTSTITPAGVLTKWDSKSEENNIITYTNAVFTAISVGNVTNLQPVLTRNEASCMTDIGLMRWDAVSNRAVTIDAPTCDEQVLTACVSGGNTNYVWQDKQPGVYCFASMACYNAYTGNIPENSTVYIADAESYMKAEEKF